MVTGDARSSSGSDLASRVAIDVSAATAPDGDSGSGAPTTSSWARWSLRLTSPTAVLVLMPSLVAVVGAALTVSSYTHVKELGRRDAVLRFSERTRHAEASIRSAISQADALVDRTREVALQHSSQAPIDGFAFALRDLALGRRGLKWLSVSFPDGTFEGVFVQEARLRFQVSRLADGKTSMSQYDFAGGSLVRRGGDDFHYDPRERDFYRSAVARRERIWTQPYPFYPDFRTGISRAEAVFRSDGELAAVVTADYDIAELSGVLTAGSKTSMFFVFSPGGVLLAQSGLGALPRMPNRERAFTFLELGNPTLAAFYQTRPAEPGSEPREFSAAAGEFVAVEQPLSFPEGLGWRLAGVTPVAVLFEAARSHGRSSLISSSTFVLASVLLSGAFAVGVGRLRRARTQAETRARGALALARRLGSYELERRIGEGGMGEVFRAHHRLLARPAAIKLIRPEKLGTNRAELEARFEREARVLASLRSPNTVSVLDFGRTTDGRLFLVMELLEGLTLDRVLKLDGAMPAARLIPILVGVCRSLAEAHAAGLVHRDVKPSNLFLCHDGDGVERVKLIDFGLVKAEENVHQTADGKIAGTPEYMAPEQARGSAVDGRTDLYGLGCTAFHLLTGRPVFREPTDVATMLAHMTQSPVPPSSLTSAYLPSELEQLILRCLVKDPECRPNSAASVGRALSAISIPEQHAVTQQVLKTWWEGVSSRDGAAEAPPSALAPNAASLETNSVSRVS